MASAWGQINVCLPWNRKVMTDFRVQNGVLWVEVWSIPTQTGIGHNPDQAGKALHCPRLGVEVWSTPTQTGIGHSPDQGRLSTGLGYAPLLSPPVSHLWTFCTGPVHWKPSKDQFWCCLYLLWEMPADYSWPSNGPLKSVPQEPVNRLE